MNGKRLGTSNRRKSKQYVSGRFCAEQYCLTQLSIYNKKKYCFLHTPVSFPRIRGHINRTQGE